MATDPIKEDAVKTPGGMPTTDALDADPAANWAVVDHETDYVALTGYVGNDTSDAHRRLYRDLRFREWVRIPEGAIRRRLKSLETDEIGRGQSMLWVERDANLVHCVAVRASSYELPAPSSQPEHPAPARAGARGGAEQDDDDGAGNTNWPR